MTQRMIASVNGIRCAGCFTAIERALLRQGATSVAIDPASRIATVLYSGTRADANGYCDAVRAAGYQATLFAVLPVPAED
ncbi:MAG: heavy metal-associated domain-containing protein [Candidatus Izemoplasmatales bacterium]